MLAYIRGTIKSVDETSLIVENNGLGYEIFCPPAVLLIAKTGAPIELYLHQQIREDANVLYGFAEPSEKQLFELLLTVSGVGPKTALNVFSEAAPRDIYSAIANEDAGALKKFSGIGAKTAERMVLELKSKIKDLILPEMIKTRAEQSADADAIDALVALGFDASEAREALKTAGADLPVEERVRAALNLLKNSK